MNRETKVAKTLYGRGYFDALNHVYYDVVYAERLEHSEEYKQGVAAGKKEVKRRKMVALLAKEMYE